MDIWPIWWIVGVLLVVSRIVADEDDVVELFKPNNANPAQLNDFLANVWKHKNDFSLIRKAAQEFQKTKKYIHHKDTLKDSVYDNDENDIDEFKLERILRRAGARKYKQKSPSTRIRRNLGENENGNKVYSMLVDNPQQSHLNLDRNLVHKTILKGKGHLLNNTKPNNSDDLFSIDLEASKPKKRWSRENDGFEKVQSFEVDSGNSPYLRSPQKTIDRHVNGRKVAKSNHNANHLGPEFVQVLRDLQNDRKNYYISKYSKLYQHHFMPGYLKKRQNLRRHHEKYKMYPQFGQKFQSRRLKFMDDGMINDKAMSDDYGDYLDRPRRDFLDALGMKNEEDYSEDNPYITAILTNTTNTSSTHESNVTSTALNSIKELLDTNTESCKKNTDLGEELSITTTLENLLRKNNITYIRKRNDVVDPAYFNDVVEHRQVRDVADDDYNDIERRIMENKDRIANDNVDPNPKFHRRIRKARKGKKHKKRRKSKKKHHHRIHKKQDNEEYVANTSNHQDSTIITTELQQNTTEKIFENEKENNATENYLRIDEQNDNLSKIIDGKSVIDIVSSVFDQVRQSSSLGRRLYPVLLRKHTNYVGSVNGNLFKTNETNQEIQQTKALVREITNVLNKVITTQVNRKICQKLPATLITFLHSITNVEGDTGFPKQVAENLDQGDFMFSISPKPVNEEKMKINDLHKNLNDLLQQFNQLDSLCQNKAGPVRDYIEDHLTLLKNCEQSATGEKRDISDISSDLIEQQLESVGLGRKHNFRPNFDINELVKHNLRQLKFKRDTKKMSEQYKKLQQAVEKMREKRASEQKIGKLFGVESHPKNKFEKPLVYNLS